MKINTATLANGLRVVHHRKKASQMVYVNLLYNVGAKNEDYEYTGLAHLLEHLMFEGTELVPSFDEPLERAGGENNAYTTNDITNYYISLPKQNAEIAFWLESDRMKNILLDAENVNVQRKVVIEEFKQTTLNRPYGDASSILRSLAFKKHPYRWSTIGRKPSHIAKVPLQVIRDFYNRYYSPSNAILAVVGDVPFEQVMQWSEKWFAPIPGTGNVQKPLPVEPRQERMRRRRVVRNVPENALYMAFHMGGRDSKDYFPCDILSDVLSNGYSGRLLARLVKEKGIFSKIDAFIDGTESPGLFRIYGRVSRGVTLQQAEAAVWEQLDELKNEEIAPDELEKVKNRFESAFIFRNLNGENLSGNLALAALHGDARLHLKEVENYRAVTTAELRSTARELFRSGNCSVLHYLSRGLNENECETN